MLRKYFEHSSSFCGYECPKKKKKKVLALTELLWLYINFQLNVLNSFSSGSSLVVQWLGLCTLSRVWFLFGELKSHRLCSAAKMNNNKIKKKFSSKQLIWHYSQLKRMKLLLYRSYYLWYMHHLHKELMHQKVSVLFVRFRDHIDELSQ